MANEEVTIEQPKPTFTLLDLEQKLAAVFTRTLNWTAYHKSFIEDAQSEQEEQLCNGLIEANSILQELIALVDQHKQEHRPIDMPSIESNPAITTILNTEKVVFTVAGVQMIHAKNGVEGVSLYSTMPKARVIRDVLNKEYARLKANYEAKIVNFPVY